MEIYSILYGLGWSVLIYLISYLSGKALLGRRALPLVVVLGKYLIYWKIIEIGFKQLNPLGVLIGLVVGIYGTLPILYLLNKKNNSTSEPSLIH